MGSAQSATSFLWRWAGVDALVFWAAGSLGAPVAGSAGPIAGAGAGAGVGVLDAVARVRLTPVGSPQNLQMVVSGSSSPLQLPQEMRPARKSALELIRVIGGVLVSAGGLGVGEGLEENGELHVRLLWVAEPVGGI